MAITPTKVMVRKVGNAADVTYDITCDSSYPTGGYAITPTTFGFTRSEAIKHISLSGLTAGGYATRWDKTNSKLMLFRTKDPGAAGGADIVLQECANAVDVHSEVFHVRAIIQ